MEWVDECEYDAVPKEMKNRPNVLLPIATGFAVVVVVLVILFVSGFGEPNILSGLFGLSNGSHNGAGGENPMGLPLSQAIAIVDILIAFLAIAITSRLARRNENALVKQVDQAENTLDALSQAVIRVDSTGQVTYLNPAAQRMLSLPDEQLPAAIDLIDNNSRQLLVPMLLASPDDVDQIPIPNEARLITRQGIELEVEGSCRIVRNGQRRPLLAILQLHDVTEEREWIRRQPDLWDRDMLTALPGRNFMINRLSRVMERERAGERPLSYLQIKLDGIQDVYREAGSKAGDALIRHLTALLRPHIRDTDLLARTDTDTFSALLTLCPEEVTERIRSSIRHSLTSSHFHWDGKTYRIGVRIGSVRIPPFSGTVEDLFAAAVADYG